MLDLLIGVLSRVLTPLFFSGMIGATIVVAVTFFHDVVDFVSDDDTSVADTATHK